MTALASTDTDSATRRAPTGAPASERLTFGPVHLDVVDLARSRAWWEEVAGLRFLAGGPELAALGVEDAAAPLVVLHRGATTPVQRGHTGMYHLAIHLPDRTSFATVLARLLTAGVEMSPIDHVMARSLYLTDPDGIGLEILLESPERAVWKQWNAEGTELTIIDDEGRRRSPASPLDVEAELLQATAADGPGGLPPGSRIGHVNLHVPDLDEGLAFYRDRLGLILSNHVPALGFADLGAGGPFEHRVAVNVWQGVGAPRRPAGAAGLNRLTIRFDTPDRLREVVSRVETTRSVDGAPLVLDPGGNALALTS